MGASRWSWAATGMAAVAMVAVAQRADAGGGQVKLARTTVQENSNAWRVMMTLQLANAPSIAHPTFRFSFQPVVMYDRSLIDGDKIVVNRTPVQNQQPIVESMEVDFSDASGKIWKGTRFDFSLTRQRGYFAGEYKLTVRSASGDTIGQPINLTLEGDNPVVDRRTMDFGAKKKPGDPVWDGGAESGIKAL